ncbi:hypothetical protein ACSBR1_022025 [Camellia fascicularis]
MMPKICLRSILLLIGMLSNASAAFVGINIGTDVSNLPPASEVVAILKTTQTIHVRLFDSDSHMLNALSTTGIEVMVSVTNEEVLCCVWLGNLERDLEREMKNPYTNITAIAVGSEVLTSFPNAAPVLVATMNYLHKALVDANLNYQIKVSTPQSMDIIARPFPPSTASFNSTWNSAIFQILQFLENTDSYYMLNAYPYNGYTNGNGIFPIDYALFQPLSSGEQIVDPNTHFHYNSMFDAMVDAAYNSMAAFNFSGIPIVVTETGWPWFGGANEPDATTENAETFNDNLIQRVLNGSGPPSQPTFPINTYIYQLFNEDMRPGPASERNWGLFYTNGTAVYSVSLITSDPISGNSSSVFCIAKRGADTNKLQSELYWACGQGYVNCSAIQPGQLCYNPDTLQSHASYAYNDYYFKMHSMGGTCDFDGTATTTTVDPSYGTCIFAGSSKSSSSTIISPTTAFGPITPSTGERSPTTAFVPITPSIGERSRTQTPAFGSLILGFIALILLDSFRVA